MASHSSTSASDEPGVEPLILVSHMPYKGQPLMQLVLDPARREELIALSRKRVKEIHVLYARIILLLLELQQLLPEMPDLSPPIANAPNPGSLPLVVVNRPRRAPPAPLRVKPKTQQPQQQQQRFTRSWMPDWSTWRFRFPEDTFATLCQGLSILLIFAPKLVVHVVFAWFSSLSSAIASESLEMGWDAVSSAANSIMGKMETQVQHITGETCSASHVVTMMVALLVGRHARAH